MQSILLTPAVRLMQRLHLLPKFVVLTLVFALPLVLVSALLLNELSVSIAYAQQERTGVSRVRAMQQIIQLAQKQRMYRHMSIMGNAGAAEKAQQLQKALGEKIVAFDAMRKSVGEHDADDMWTQVLNNWAALQQKLATVKDRKIYNDQTAFIAQLERFNTAIADRSRLTHDPEVATYYLAGLFTRDFPQITEGLAEIAGRGAAYIDSGLMEGNEEVLLGSTVLVTRRDLVAIPGKLETLFQENPALKQKMAASGNVVNTAIAYLDRARNEVLNSVDQTSGDRFAEAGNAGIDQLYAAAGTSADLLDSLLQARIERDAMRRNLIAVSILAILALAGYFLFGFYASFSSEVRRLGDAVTRVAAGDLSTRIASKGRDEIAQLLNAFGGMNERLAHLVAQVRSGSNTIALAAHEIASGNQHLSTRTEEQAGSLEETAASMEQLTSTVRQNAENAQQANQLAQSASGVAQQGGLVVTQVVDTMAAIQQSARQIGDIISVVDSIAFQTNILALNAAVEAARAGEGGRGFAVVAAEVRNLAQRSATAAKEIKLLIADSVEKVDAGGRQVVLAGKTMHEIVASIGRVTSIMQEITAASHEQQDGIEHINRAMSQMDDITQQNAALVEQAAAATESMHAQTVSLTKTVAVFRLADDERMALTAGAHKHDNVMPLVKRTVAPAGNRSSRASGERRLAVANGYAADYDAEWEEV